MTTWTDICKTDDIPPNSGRAALFNGQQIAIFRTHKNNKIGFTQSVITAHLLM